MNSNQLCQERWQLLEKNLLPTHLYVKRSPRHVILPFVLSLSKGYREIKSYSELVFKLLTNKSEQDLAGALKSGNI